jgi:two-component system KDP operon response regulator KdpE
MPTSKPKILVIDDDEQIRHSLRAILSVKGYQVILAASGDEGLDVAVDEQPALVILDLSMPGMSGLDVCQALRAWYRNPILVLSVLEHESDKIAAFTLGADDYVTKPFSIGELLARLEAHLRRVRGHTQTPPAVVIAGPLHVDLVRRRVQQAGEELKLTPIEYEILALLALYPDCAVTNRMFFDHIWGVGAAGDHSLLRVHVSNLRRKLGATAEGLHFIVTEPGVGFRLVTDPGASVPSERSCPESPAPQ